MNKQELIEKIKALKPYEPDLYEYDSEELKRFEEGFSDAKIYAELAVKELDEPEKPKVPQVAVEFYERYKDDNLALGEWFDDFYSPEAIEEFPRMDELTEWLYDNNDEINRQREFALATLVTIGIEAVEVEKEKLYTVEIPNPGATLHFVLCKYAESEVSISYYSSDNWRNHKCTQLTEAEIKKDFEWAFRWAKEVEE